MTPPPDDPEIPRGIAVPDASPVTVHFDGACQTVGRRRVAAYGCTVEGAGLAHEECGLAVPPGHPRSTNNVAEYIGAIRALEWLAAVPYAADVLVQGDSELVIRQMNGEYAVHADHLKPYHERLGQLARRFHHVEFRWVPREQNRRADELSKEGIDSVGIPPPRAAKSSDGEDVGDDADEPSD
ncbi:MAG TPA: ribonuclease HI family protein [Thermoplasmata archaeon]|nr:ribonuclease HI family protein [Thermoplasmata archaeon]